jgi:hypothetical protein
VIVSVILFRWNLEIAVAITATVRAIFCGVAISALRNLNIPIF